MNNALLYLGGVILVALAALFAVPLAVDWNQYRGVFEEEATRVLGREVRVGGGVNLRFLPTPYVRFEKVRIADDVGITGDPLFRADSFTMWLSITPLLRGRLEAYDVELKRPILTLRFDEKGLGNWQTFKVSPGHFSFIPSAVALKSVRISEGILKLHRAQGEAIVRLGKITGELAADSLSGPYRFRGETELGGALQDIKFSTSAVEPDGTSKLKLTVQNQKASRSAVFEGALVDVAARARLEGTLSGHLPLSDVLGAGEVSLATPGSRDGASSGLGMAPGLEFKGKLAADASEATLSTIEFSLETGGRLQTMTGDARAVWDMDVARRPNAEAEAVPLDLTLKLAAKWLDLDGQTGQAKASQSPVELGHRLAAQVAAVLPVQAMSHVTAVFDQVRLGDEGLGKVEISMERSGEDIGPLSIAMGLPGGGHGVVEGTYRAQTAGFEGQVRAWGPSLARTQAWAVHASQPEVVPTSGSTPATSLTWKSDGPYLVQATIRLTDGTIELSDAAAELDQGRLSGGLTYTWPTAPNSAKPRTARRALKLDITSPRLKLVGLAPDVLTLKGLSRYFGAGDAASPAQALDLSVSLDAGEIKDGDRLWRQIDAKLARSGDKLTIERLKFASPSGLQVKLDGELNALSTTATGRLLADVTVTSSEALADLERTLDLGAGSLSKNPRVQALLPTHVATELELRGQGETQIGLSGAVDGGDLSARVQFKAGLAAWRTTPLDGVASLSGPHASDLVRALLNEVSGTTEPISAAAFLGSSAAAREAVANDRLSATFKGSLDTRVQAEARFKSANLDMSAYGSVRAPEAKLQTADGEIAISPSSLGGVLALAGLKPGAGQEAMAASGRLVASASDGRLTVSSMGESLRLGDITLSAKVEIATNGAGPERRHQIMAEVTSPAADLPMMLGSFTAPDGSGTEPAGVWSDAPLELAGLDGWSGTVEINTKSLLIAPGVAVKNALVKTDLSPGRLSIVSLTGEALGGRVRASGTLIGKAGPGKAGASMAGTQAAGAQAQALQLKLALDSVQMEQMTSEVASEIAPFIEGKGAVELQMSGAGLSLRDIVASLSGAGALDLSASKLRRFTPSALAALAQAAITAKASAAEVELDQGVKSALARGAVTVAARKIPLTVAAGALKTSATDIVGLGGRTRVSASLDLTRLAVESQWSVVLEPLLGRPAPGAAPLSPSDEPLARALPPIDITYAGPLAEIARLEPKFETQSFVRDVGLRRAERDAAELERVRREDEARVRAEAERQAALAEDRLRMLATEQARAQAAAAAAAGATPLGSTLSEPLAPGSEAVSGQAGTTAGVWTGTTEIRLPSVSSSPPATPLLGAPSGANDPPAEIGAVPSSQPGATLLPPAPTETVRVRRTDTTPESQPRPQRSKSERSPPRPSVQTSQSPKGYSASRAAQASER